MKLWLTILASSTLLLSHSSFALSANADAVVKHYADMVEAVYGDSLTTARTLQTKIDAFIATPSNEKLKAAKTAWKAARVPYQQSETFRFGNAAIDDWEGKVNAWPLDEGLIDYVAKDYTHEEGNAAADANVISRLKIKVGTKEVDAKKITPDLLTQLHEIGGSEANVATGYHAIEFLLWGQDLNGTNAGAGERPYTDFLQDKGCTSGADNRVDAVVCKRRAAYLRSATELLVHDLSDMTQQWANKGAARQALLSADSREGLRRILFGMGSLSLGELAGERMKVALVANSTEDEHDCFSDNTHYSHFYNGQGIKNVYTGNFITSTGKEIRGASLSDLVAASAPELDKKVRAAFDNTMEKLTAMVDSAEKKSVHFDQLIAAGNKEGKQMVQAAISALVAQTKAIEGVAKAVGIDNLSPDNADHQF